MTQYIKPHEASPFEIFMAKIAGQRIEVKEDGHLLVAYLYKGHVYVVEFYKIT